MHPTVTRFAAVLLGVATAIACSRTETQTRRTDTVTPAAGVRVSDIAVGRTLNPDKTVADKTGNFIPTDTIYVSVKTDGAAQSARLQTRWYFGDRVVEESSDMISPTGPAVTEFHLSKPDGWPVGSYKIEVLLNGVPAGARTFEVKPAA
jgi:hypothetical protein